MKDHPCKNGKMFLLCKVIKWNYAMNKMELVLVDEVLNEKQALAVELHWGDGGKLVEASRRLLKERKMDVIIIKTLKEKIKWIKLFPVKWLGKAQGADH